MKVAIVGPLPPWRGGVAHSNAILCTNLQKRNEVLAISFSRQFPPLLYPGKQQRDPDAKPVPVRTLHALDSINPRSWRRIGALLRRERPDLLVFQWWSPFFTPCYLALARQAKRAGIRTAAICQNVQVHERGLQGWLAPRLTRLFFQQMDHLIAYSSSDRADAQRLAPGVPVAFIVEGTYGSQLGRSIPKAAAQRQLGMRGRNILFFGFVRPYKGLRYLLEALPAVPGVTLHVVGEFWKDKQDYLDSIREHGLEKRVRLVDRYVSDEEAVRYFSAVDAVVLPYTSSTESGIIQLAYGLRTPIITTAVGGNGDLIQDGVSGLLVPPADPAALAAALRRFYDRKLEQRLRTGMSRNQRVFAWTPEKERRFLGV